MGMGPGMMAVGSGLSTLGQISGGIAARRAGEVNARIQEAQADNIETVTFAQGEQHRRQFDKFRGALRGDLAAYGASSSTGTGLLLAMDAERQAKLDEMNIITEGVNKAQAVRQGAQMSRYEGRVRQRQAVLGGLGSALSGFANYSSATGNTSFGAA